MHAPANQIIVEPEGGPTVQTGNIMPETRAAPPAAAATLVMVELGSEPWFEPELSRTEPKLGSRFGI